MDPIKGTVTNVDLVIHGSSIEELLADLTEQLDFCKREFIEKDDSTLTDDAIEFKRRLIPLFSKRNESVREREEQWSRAAADAITVALSRG